MDLDERARWYTVAAMQEAQRVQPVNAVPANVAVGLPITELFQRARFRDAERAAAWWQVLRQRFPKDPAAKTLDTLRAIDARKHERRRTCRRCATRRAAERGADGRRRSATRSSS